MSLDTILKTSKALADETRLAIYRHLTTRRGPVGVVDVAASFSLHPNAARAHLAKLEAAGLATSAPERIGGSGRPRRVWRVAASGLAPVFEPAVFKAVAGLLLDLVDEQTSLTAAQILAYGRRWGRGYASRFSQDGSVEALCADYVLTGLVRTLVTWGFTASRQGEREVLVDRCPLADLSERHEERVCPLIHGVLQGMLEAVRPELEFDWARGAGGEGCEIQLP